MLSFFSILIFLNSRFFALFSPIPMALASQNESFVPVFTDLNTKLQWSKVLRERYANGCDSENPIPEIGPYVYDQDKCGYNYEFKIDSDGQPKCKGAGGDFSIDYCAIEKNGKLAKFDDEGNLIAAAGTSKAAIACAELNARLPTISEVKSLFNRFNLEQVKCFYNSALKCPFNDNMDDVMDVASQIGWDYKYGTFWSSSLSPERSMLATTYNIFNGYIGSFFIKESQSHRYVPQYVMCVREIPK